MISDFDFYNLPKMTSQKTRVIKNIYGSSIIEDYKIHSESGVRHSSEDDFSITVPAFDGWQGVTYVKRNDGTWGIVEDCREDTRDRSKVTFVTSFDPFLTFTSTGWDMTFEALWKKIPYPHPLAKRGTVLDDSNLIESRKAGLTTMSLQDTKVLPDIKNYDMVWVEITTSCSLYGTLNETGRLFYSVDLRSDVEKSVANQSSQWKYGFFALYSAGEPVPRIQICNSGFDGWELIEYYKEGSTERTRTTLDYTLFYPSLSDVIHDPDQVLGIPTDAILDVSVTAWCPYKFRNYTLTQDGVLYTFPMLEDTVTSGYIPYIIRGSNLKTYQRYGSGSSTYGRTVMYELGRTNESFFKRDNWDEHTLSLTMDEYVCGEVNLRDANGSVIANIPRDYFEYDYDTGLWNLDYKAQTYTDTTGLYTRVDVGKDTPHIITFPEGKLPYVGDAWTQYRIREMSYDRQALENTKEQAWLQFGAGVADALVGGGMTMAMGRVGAASQRTEAGRNLATGMSIGGGIVSSALNTVLSIHAAEQEQDLVEARQKGACGTGYNTGYGISYCDNAFDIGAGFVVMMPSRFDPDDAHAQGNYYGYNADFVGDLSICDMDGYYEGVITKQIPMGGGSVIPTRWCDRLSELLMNGVRIQRI